MTSPTSGRDVDLRDTDDPTKPVAADQSLGDLVGRLSTDVGELISTQFELAKAEIRQDLDQARRAATMLAGAAVVGLLAAVLLSFAAAWGLAEVVEPGWAFLIVGVVYVVVAAVLFQQGRERIRAATPVAEETRETLKEDVEWARQQRS